MKESKREREREREREEERGGGLTYAHLNTRKTESRCAHGKLARVGGGKFKGHEQRDNASG